MEFVQVLNSSLHPLPPPTPCFNNDIQFAERKSHSLSNAALGARISGIWGRGPESTIDTQLQRRRNLVALNRLISDSMGTLRTLCRTRYMGGKGRDMAALPRSRTQPYQQLWLRYVVAATVLSVPICSKVLEMAPESGPKKGVKMPFSGKWNAKNYTAGN